MAREYRSLNLRGATGALRTATFRTREHLVVPVVALVEGVIQAVNAEFPEFVPAEVIKRVPTAWNNRAVVADHPVEGGTQVSANAPHILEAYQFGHIFNSSAPEDRLVVEAWIDESLIRTGTVAEQVVRRLKNGEVVEVSVGAYVFTEPREGTFKGLKYYAVWTEIIPDHLAMLNENDVGACSVEMGCGALRSNKAYLVTASGLVEEKKMHKCSRCQKELAEGATCDCPEQTATPPEPLTLRQRVLKIFNFRSNKAEDLTSSDLSAELDRSLRAIEPGYQGVLDILLNQNKVVYVTAPEDSWKLFQRTYSVDGDGAVEISDDAEEVRMVNRYEPVAAARAAAAATTPCGCHQQAALQQSGEANMDKNARIAALIAAGTYKDSDKPWLETMPVEALEALAKGHTPAAPAPAPAPAPAALTGGATRQTAEQFIGTIDDPMLRESLMDGYRASQQRRAALITALKGTGRNKFTDEQLLAFSTDHLQNLAELATVPVATLVPANYALRGVPQPEPVSEEVIEAPPSLITALQGKK